MSTPVPESSSPHAEPQAAARRTRIAGLALMVFEFIRERYLGGIVHEFDGVERSELIAALRACSSYADHITCLYSEDPNEDFPVQIQGIDGHNYLIQFKLTGPGISVHAARVRVTDPSLIVGDKGQSDGKLAAFYILQEHSVRLKLGEVTAERAFLIGMSRIIGLIDQDGEVRDERLDPLFKLITLRREELRQIRPKHTPFPMNYDEEVDQPF